jgi:Arylsulfatase A and related enzymes
MSPSLVLRGFLSLYLPLAWAGSVFAVRRFSSWPDFAALYVISAAAIVVLALVAWGLLELATMLMGLLLRRANRRTIATCIFAMVASVALGLFAHRWLASVGIAASRRTVVSLFGAACIAAMVFRHEWVSNAVEAAINNAWQIIRIPLLATLAVSAVLGAIGMTRAAEPEQAGQVSTGARPVNSVLLITVDTFSASRSSLYGANEATTPFLEKFARDSVVFDNAIAVSNFTAPTMTSTHTGKYPWTHGILSQQGYMDSAPRTIASTLHAAGFQTAFFNANWWADPRHTLSDAGWDHLEGPFHAVLTPAAGTRLCSRAICDTARLATIPPFNELKIAFGDVLRRVGALERVHYPPELVLRPATNWIVAHKTASSPQFVWIHLYPPHDPYLAPRPFLYSILNSPDLDTIAELLPQRLYQFSDTDEGRVRQLEARYKESLKYLDDRLGAFLNDPRIADFVDRSVVVIAADHGESFERGFLAHTGPLLTQSLIHIPLLIRTPAMHGGRRIDTPVSQADILPTILDLLGLPTPDGVDGLSLAPVLEGETAARRPIFSMNFERAYAGRPLSDQPWSVAVIDWPWKFVLYNRQRDLQPELYNLQLDAGETRNLARSNPEQVKSLSSRIHAALLASDER